MGNRGVLLLGLLVACGTCLAQSGGDLPPKNLSASAGAMSSAESGNASLSADALRFDNQALNTTSAVQLITLINNGKQKLTIKKITSASAEFVVIHNCPSSPDSLSTGAACTITVRFAPVTAGMHNGSIAVQTSPERPLAIALTGIGVVSPVMLSQTHLVFASQLVGTVGRPQVVSLINRSDTTPLRIRSIEVTRNFALDTVHDACLNGSTLAPLANCKLWVRFAPNDLGSLSGRITIFDSDVASPHVAGLFGLATGVKLSPAILKWDPTLLDTTGTAQKVEVTNAGNVPVDIARIETSGDFLEQNACGNRLLEQQSCSIVVRFKPTDAGKRLGRISIRDSDPTGLQVAPLVGFGTPVELSPANIDFGTQELGSSGAPKAVTITNRSRSILRITALNISGDFVIPLSKCGTTLAAGQSCELEISFSPTVVGTRTGSLSIEADRSRSLLRIPLSGIGR